MAMPWMKMSLSFRMDPKIESLSDAQHRVWYKIMVFAAEQRTRGLIRFDSAEVLALEVSRGDVKLLNETISRLVNLGIVTLLEAGNEGPESRVTGALHGALQGGSILVKNYEIESVTRNASVTRDRVRKHRENKKLRESEDGNVTPLKRDVTHVTRVTPREELEKRREEPPIGGEFTPARAHETDRLINSEISTPQTNGHAVASAGMASGQSRINGHVEADPVIPFRLPSASSSTMAKESPRMPATVRSAVETGNLPSNVRNGHHEPFRPSGELDAGKAIAAARAEWGDEIANLMDLMSHDIDQSLGGRWDCYLAAMRKVKRSSKRIDNLHPYVLKIALGYAAHGIPQEPVAHIPTIANGLDDVDPETKAKNKARREAYVEELMADIAAKKAKEQRKVCY